MRYLILLLALFLTSCGSDEMYSVKIVCPNGSTRKIYVKGVGGDSNLWVYHTDWEVCKEKDCMDKMREWGNKC